MHGTVVIDGRLFFRLIRDDAFYDALPASMEPLREACKRAAEEALFRLLAFWQGGERFATVDTLLQAAVDEFCRAAAAVYRADPSQFGPLFDYMEKKRGYPVSRLVLYHKGMEGGRSRHTLVIDAAGKDGTQAQTDAVSGDERQLPVGGGLPPAGGGE